jgi:hypothetical protein
MTQTVQGLNLKNIVADFQLLADRHKQINSFGFGDTDEFTYQVDRRDKEVNLSDQAPYYPYFYVVPSNVIQEFNFMTYEFQLIVSDIMKRDMDNMTDILSDTLQIMNDVISMFRLSYTEANGNYNEFYYVDEAVTIIPFIERYEDLLCGYSATLRIKTRTPLDRCVAAFNEFPSDPCVSPTPTPSITPSPTQTPNPTQTPTTTPTQTPTTTPTTTPTPTPSPEPPFNPLSLGNLQHYYLSTSGATASSWTNLGLLGGAITQGDPLDQPSIITETLGSFTGTAVSYINGDRMVGGFTRTDFSSSTIFWVAKINSVDTARGWSIIMGDSISGINTAIQTFPLQISKDPSVLDAPSLGTPELLMSASGTTASFFNASWNDLPSQFTNPFTGGDFSDVFNLGDNQGQTTSDISIFEFMVYNRLLTNSEYLQVTNYLKTKYQYSTW